MSPRGPANPLRRHAKLGLAETVQVVDLFAHGVGVNTAACAIGISRKTMRGLYLDLRDRLADPLFVRWHRANAALVSLAGAEEIALVKAALFELLAECHAQDTCYRNFRAGRRASPICRACPLHGKFGTPEKDALAAEAVNSLRAFYHGLNIYAEDGIAPVVLFRRRLIHMATVATLMQNSRKLSAIRMDPGEKTFLSFGTFREILIGHMLTYFATERGIINSFL
ncbi:hypothetical protein K9U40_13735 [Xanthobacter autotrophicus]|uniref:hypothetical protein n=1 Tax=Xanthobacter TaxID=279 RepID=UPI0024AA11DB|nr:hypothetical protein [Xanthobacter autotrophicus]MDI4665381.1 hypothetical protein [Xanthobacter autotrophicus]